MQLTIFKYWRVQTNTVWVKGKKREKGKTGGKHTRGTSSHFHQKKKKKTADNVGSSAGVGIYNVLFIIICLIFAEY